MSHDFAIKVENVSKVFKLPHEKTTSIKGALINLFRGNRTFERQQVLDNVSLEVQKGEFFAIVGRNGSGKSTLLKMLAGIYRPTEGGITVNGKLTPFIELGVGFSPELTGRENVFLNGALLGFNRKEMMEMYDDIAKFSEIERFMDQKLKNYSSGMQVRLAFSIAIRARSDILLLDEVLAVGDAAFQQKCFDYFEKLKRNKQTVVFVTHDMNAVKRFCTRAVYIKNGKVIKDGTPSEIADIYLEENMEARQNVDGKKNDNKDYSVSAELIAQNESNTVIGVNYKSSKKEDLYIGMALIKDGVTVAEITTPIEKPLNGKGKVSYSIDTSILNTGVYYMDAALFRMENRELVAAVYDKKVQFAVRGEQDITKGSALKLADNWDY